MDFDQMLDAWRTQDDRPLYGINRDLLGLVVRHEQAGLKRQLRREQWTTYGVGAGMAAFAGFWLWVLVYTRGSALVTVIAGVGTAAILAGMLALWVSLRRQALRERQFGNTLRAEIMRHLSLLDFQLSRYGRWGSAMLWAAPVMIGASLLSWLAVEINGLSAGYHAWLIAAPIATLFIIAQASSRETRRQLGPRRQRLAELLGRLDGGEN